MGKRGAKPEPTAIKLARGTFTARRDAGRMDLKPPHGAPLKPPELDGEGALLWDRIVAEHSSRGTLGTIDTAALTTLCQSLNFKAKCAELLAIDPTDKDTRCSYATYVAICDKLGAKFGWTASDRAALKLGGGDKKPTVPTRARA